MILTRSARILALSTQCSHNFPGKTEQSNTNHSLTKEQTLALQLDALKQADCTNIFTDTISGSTTERPGLDQALTFLRSGDILVVWRLGRPLRHLIDTITDLQKRDIGFNTNVRSVVHH